MQGLSGQMKEGMTYIEQQLGQYQISEDNIHDGLPPQQLDELQFVSN